MSKTIDGKKIVHVNPYEKTDGTNVHEHFRSTPDHCPPTSEAQKAPPSQEEPSGLLESWKRKIGGWFGF